MFLICASRSSHVFIDCWIVEIYNLYHCVFIWTIMVVIQKFSVSFSWKNPPLPSSYSFRFDWLLLLLLLLLFWNRALNSVTVEPVYCFLHTFYVNNSKQQLKLLQSKWKLILYTSPVTVLLNSLPDLNRLKIWQLPDQIWQLHLPHGKLPCSVSSVNLNFQRIKLSRYVFELRKATRCGLDKAVFAKSNFCTCRCTFFNTSRTICSTGWKVNTRVTPSSRYFGDFWWRLFLLIKFTFWISGRMISNL